MPHRFIDRIDAGRQLAGALTKYKGVEDVIVVGLPRGGVPVAFEVAAVLGRPLDVLIVRKLGAPGQPELAMGAIASGGVIRWDYSMIDALDVTPGQQQAVVAKETQELIRREQVYRAGLGPLDVRDRQVILVDDGLATGTTMLAACSALRDYGARRLIAAFPVGSPEGCRRISGEIDEMVCLLKPRDLIAISLWYDDFRQVSDDEVRQLLRQAAVSHRPSESLVAE